MEPDEDPFAGLEPGAVAHGSRDRVREGRPARGPLCDPERDLGCVPEKQRRHDHGDQAEDQVGLTEMAALEARGPLDLADPERGDHADEDQDAEDVDEEEVPALVAEPRERPVLVDRSEQRHEDRREEDDEPPEDEGVDETGDDALEELPLTEHDGRLGPRPSTGVAGAVGRLPEPDDAVEEVGTTPEEHSCDHERDEKGERGGECGHGRAARSAAEIAGTTSCMSPITA